MRCRSRTLTDDHSPGGVRGNAWRGVIRSWQNHDRRSARGTSRGALPPVLVERREIAPRRTLDGTREDIRPTCRRGRLIPEDARPSPSYPEEHLQGRNFSPMYTGLISQSLDRAQSRRAFTLYIIAIYQYHSRYTIIYDDCIILLFFSRVLQLGPASVGEAASQK